MPANTRLVIDASIVVKWFHQENKTNSALELLEKINYGSVSVLAPNLIIYEVSNALIRGIGKPIKEVLEAIDLLMEISWQIIAPSTGIIKSALQFTAHTKQLSFYDAAYLALAQHHDAVVLTDDRKLFQIVGKPLVRLL